MLLINQLKKLLAILTESVLKIKLMKCEGVKEKKGWIFPSLT
jgi:hypothetical protein